MILTIHDIVSLSGLTRAQINLLISRYGVGVWGRADSGEGRNFEPVDAFNFCVAGALYRLGLRQPKIRTALGAMPLVRLDGTTGQPAAFPECAGVAANSVLVFTPDGSLTPDNLDLSCSVTNWEGVARLQPNGLEALVVDAGSIIRKIQLRQRGDRK